MSAFGVASLTRWRECCRAIRARALGRLGNDIAPARYGRFENLGGQMTRGYRVLALIWVAAIFALLSPPDSAGASLPAAAITPHPREDGNTIRLTSARGVPVRNYPFQFGRPFLPGAIPSGRCPGVLLDGRAVMSQADVKNRYPDGSVEFAVIAVVVPSIPARNGVTLSFAPRECNNTPLSRAQMLDPGYRFDAAETLAFSARLVGGAPPVASLATWRAITDGGFTITVNGVPHVVRRLDFSKITDAGRGTLLPILRAGLAAAHVPAAISFAQAPPDMERSVLVIQTAATGPAASISRLSAPPAGITDISGLLGLAQGGSLIAKGSQATASACKMLENGDYKLWTAGPVAQTVILADDSAAAKYDIGPGDGHKPFRPRFYATFWPATHQVAIRVVGESDNTTAVEDLAYRLAIAVGEGAESPVYTADLTATERPAKGNGQTKEHWAMTNWTKRFWLGGRPPEEVDIDNNLAYLEKTGFIPNYDAAIRLSPSGIATEYGYWTGKPHDLYDGNWDGGLWTSGMGETGERQEIGPYPQWSVMWLYSGDWRLRQMALGMADLAAAFPGNLREGDPAKRLSRADPVGSGSGLGHTVSITDRPTLTLFVIEADYTKPGQRVVFVGPRDPYTAWTFDGAHQPAAFYPQYILTGDPWYLNQIYLWAGFSAGLYDGAVTNASNGRGPSGSYGGIDDQLRGAAWVGRSRAEAAFAAPDTAPEKAYFTYLMNDALARWEGSLGIDGTVYDGTTEKNWGRQVGNYYSTNLGPESTKPPPMGNWESLGYPKNDAYVDTQARELIFKPRDEPGAAGSFTLPWQQWFVQYALAREEELGFAAGPLRRAAGRFLAGMINDSGHPELIGISYWPTERSCLNSAGGCTAPPGGFFTTWAQAEGALTVPYLTCVGWNPKGNIGYGCLDEYFQHRRQADNAAMFVMPGLAAMAQYRDPGAERAWKWFLPKVYRAIPAADLASCPKWAILPRADANPLPRQPTATPP